VVVGLILTIGIVMVTSAGYIIATGKYADGFYYTKKQAISIIAGLILMYVCSLLRPEVWRRLASILLIVGVSLLLLLFMPGFGVELGGSRRWLQMPLGFYLQPSEFVKYALVIFLAASIAKKGETIKELLTGFLPNILVIGGVVCLVLAQPDFGTAVIITTVGFLMMFVSGFRVRHLIGSIVLCTPFLVHFAMSAPYRLSRLKIFLDPWGDPLKGGFQVIQSMVAFGCGGAWGVGIGKGIQKLFYLPQPHTDFIFAVAGEELGFMGIITLIMLFYVLIVRGLAISIKTSDGFEKYLAFGITSLIGLQAMIHMAVSMGLLPTKGLPLPLVSLGGSSMIMNLMGLGILMAIAKNDESYPREALQ
jgi:cell division protein FtsW